MKLNRIFPLLLAAALQVMPLVRTALPQVQALAPSTWAIILRLTTGGLALFGFDAISSASSIAISPVNATNGVPYVGTVTYSGSHAAEVSAMTITNLCMTSGRTVAPGLTIVYSGVNKATVSGTPTGTGNFPFTLKMWDTGCSSGLSDTRSATLVVGAPASTNVAPSIVAAPQSVTAQVGADVLFSAGASGTPLPRYYWYLGVPSPSTLVGTNSSFSFTNVQLTNAGLYTVMASNSVGTASATAYLSVCKTAGTNILAFHYTNYVAVSNSILMSSFITNAPAGSNTYKWQYNYVDITTYSTSGSNLTLSANSVYANHSGIYSVVFNGVVGGSTVVDQQAYDSYWAFGAAPAINASPQNTNVLAGTNVTFSVSASVQQNPYGTNVPLGFLWYLNGTNLVSAQSNIGSNQTATLNLPAVTSANSGTYTVVVTNYWGTATSSPAVLAVAFPPSITSPPLSRTVLAGQNTSFSVAATGAAPLNYQWQKNGINLSDGGVWSGVNASVLSLLGVSASDNGSYSVVVTNSSGSVTGGPATLNVVNSPSVGLALDGLNNVILSANTVTGLNFVVEVASNLSAPIQWTPLNTNIISGSGQLSFTNSSGSAQQYFRVRFP